MSVVPSRRRMTDGSDAVRLSPGTRMKSTVDGTEIVVVRAPKGFVDLRCGGHPMVPFSEDVPRPNRLDPKYDGGTEIGKRYALETLGIEVVCTKSGRGSL